MELYLQHFFSEVTISKNLISPLFFNNKKCTYRKRTQKNFVVLTLLPKIDIIRLTNKNNC